VFWSAAHKQLGNVYVDGAHASHRLQLGDELELQAGSPLWLFSSDKQRFLS
jgi:hypothetical protein